MWFSLELGKPSLSFPLSSLLLLQAIPGASSCTRRPAFFTFFVGQISDLSRAATTLAVNLSELRGEEEEEKRKEGRAVAFALFCPKATPRSHLAGL